MTSTTSMVESEHSPSSAPVLPCTVYILTRFSPRRYVWLVPRYTTEWSAAAVRFELVIQGGANGSLQDLAKGAGGDFRYLIPVPSARVITLRRGCTRAWAGVSCPMDTRYWTSE